MNNNIEQYIAELDEKRHPFANCVRSILLHSNSEDYLIGNLKRLVRELEVKHESDQQALNYMLQNSEQFDN